MSGLRQQSTETGAVVLRTARLVLRPPAAADAPRIVEHLGAFEVAQMLRPVPHPYRHDDALDWLSGRHDAPETVHFALDAGDGLIGVVSLGGAPDPGLRHYGIWLGPPFWGKGLITEASTAAFDWAFGDPALDRIDSYHFVDNQGSRRVHQKLGFVETGAAEVYCVARGARVATQTYALSRTQWEAQRAKLT